MEHEEIRAINSCYEELIEHLDQIKPQFEHDVLDNTVQITDKEEWLTHIKRVDGAYSTLLAILCSRNVNLPELARKLEIARCLTEDIILPSYQTVQEEAFCFANVATAPTICFEQTKAYIDYPTLVKVTPSIVENVPRNDAHHWSANQSGLAAAPSVLSDNVEITIVFQNGETEQLENELSQPYRHVQSSVPAGTAGGLMGTSTQIQNLATTTEPFATVTVEPFTERCLATATKQQHEQLVNNERSEPKPSVMQDQTDYIDDDTPARSATVIEEIDDTDFVYIDKPCYADDTLQLRKETPVQRRVAFANSESMSDDSGTYDVGDIGIPDPRFAAKFRPDIHLAVQDSDTEGDEIINESALSKQIVKRTNESPRNVNLARQNDGLNVTSARKDHKNPSNDGTDNRDVGLLNPETNKSHQISTTFVPAMVQQPLVDNEEERHEKRLGNHIMEPRKNLVLHALGLPPQNDRNTQSTADEIAGTAEERQPVLRTSVPVTKNSGSNDSTTPISVTATRASPTTHRSLHSETPVSVTATCASPTTHRSSHPETPVSVTATRASPTTYRSSQPETPASVTATRASPTTHRSSHPETPISSMNDDCRVLSIECSPSACIVAVATALEMLEAKLQSQENFARLLDNFDLVIGSGFGAILAAALATGSYTGAECVELSKNLCKTVFARPRKLRFAWKLRTKYNTRSLTSFLKETFTERAKFEDIVNAKPILCITSAQKKGTNGRCELHNFYTTANGTKTVKLWEALYASCTTPHYWKPAIVNGNNFVSSAKFPQKAEYAAAEIFPDCHCAKFLNLSAHIEPKASGTKTNLKCLSRNSDSFLTSYELPADAHGTSIDGRVPSHRYIDIALPAKFNHCETNMETLKELQDYAVSYIDENTYLTVN